jgi:hypothetical protein
VPNYWTKIGDATAAQPGDQVFEGDGETFVLGEADDAATKQSIAAAYNVPPGSVKFPLKKK